MPLRKGRIDESNVFKEDTVPLGNVLGAWTRTDDQLDSYQMDKNNVDPIHKPFL